MEEKKSAPFQGMLEKILEHPEQLLGAISVLQGMRDTPTPTFSEGAGIADTAKENLDASPTASEDGAQEQNEHQESQATPTFSGDMRGKGKHRKRELLCAIKPYLKEDKKAQLERILHMADLLTLIKNA